MSVPSSVSFQTLSGDFGPVLGEVARLRLSLFREFPYLYDGTEEAEAAHLQTYVQAPGALLVLARDETAGGRVVGACTAVPLVAEDADFLRPFAAAGIDPATVLYLGEALLEDEYQSRGLGGELLSQVEAHAQALGLPIVAAAMVVRSEDHPQRPRGWRSPSHLLERRGYVMHPELEITLSWQEIGESAPSSKPMRFWVKGLEGQSRMENGAGGSAVRAPA
ncbi:GNAT family N-acetyltransferase [Deinococcus wulumuqiensis]|uniref:GNAT family N-acetyltransferase n=1 Tax=Deinococcus wulumuqiensis TaxID=980427 RepID=UPI0013C36832|nr:GNAT family N-acetyltransferase [Deinococcus wulumuqiensis]